MAKTWQKPKSNLVLGVTRKMTPKEIHSEYLKKTMSCHPDIHGDEKKDEYLALQKAYEQIKGRFFSEIFKNDRISIEMGTKGGQEWSGSAFSFEKAQTAKKTPPTSFKFMANATEWNNTRQFMSNDNITEQLQSTSYGSKNTMERVKDPRFYTKESSDASNASENQGGLFQKMGLSDKLKKFRDGLERKKE